MTHRIESAKHRSPLSEQVWEHEARARELGLALVVELHLDRERKSRALGKLWKQGGNIVGDTLSGIYLLRVDVARVGPERAVGLTPYALFGVPLFVAWNPLGQVLNRGAISTTSEDELIGTLSAFFEDVSAGRKYELHPAPKLPGQAQLERPPVSPDDAKEQRHDPTAQLAAELDAFIINALSVSREFLRGHDLRDDLSLHSLRQLDALLDENPHALLGADLEGRYLAALGVYLGAVVRANAEACWVVDKTQSSAVDALTLRVEGPDGERIFRPIAIALERLRDEHQGFYGHAVAMSRRI